MVKSVDPGRKEGRLGKRQTRDILKEGAPRIKCHE